ncbi:hypothetical protein [Rhodoferax sp. GW822-FHT02A01]|uniref:hypothetical protein n=1 Tax=Rhodoferax sp. GW822-FHT02A01 TaxID=3141537 RepID=UPI00315CEBB4
MTDSSGNAACNPTLSSLTTDANGKFSCVLNSGESAPFLIVATDNSGNYAPMVSLATTTPSAGTTSTANVTPITTVMASQAGLSATSGGSALTPSVVSNFEAVVTNVATQLAPIAASLGISNYNPLTTPITAASASQTGNPADAILDVVVVSTDQSSNASVFNLIDGSNSMPIPVAGPSTSNPPTVPAPTVAISEFGQLSALNSNLASALNACFSGTTASARITGANTNLPSTQGGTAWTSLGSTCQTFGNLLSSANGSVPTYMHNGYLAAQHFYGLLNSSSMDVTNGISAKFLAASVMQMLPANNSGTGIAIYDRAVLNLVYTDATGNPGNFITLATYINGQWYVTGNQQSVDIAIRTKLRMVTELNPSPLNGTFSRYQTGLVFSINTQGPGSINSGQPLTAAVVTGPGLPNGGISLIAPDSTNEPGQIYMDIATSITSTTNSGRCGNTGTNNSFECPNYWFTRTNGLTGTNATTLHANPTGPVWDQSASAQSDSLLVAKGATYTFNLYYGGSNTATVTIKKTLLSDLIPATSGISQQWNTLGSNSNNLMSPTGSLTGTLQQATVDWIQNPLATQVSGVNMSVLANGSYGLAQSVPKGSLSIVYNPSVLSGANQTISALAAGSNGSARGLLIALRTLDSSQRDMVYVFDK